jgi:dienelactone hydrolase
MLGCNARMSVACIRFLLAAVLAMASTCTHAADAVSFAARDGVQVFADYYSAGSKAKPLILLFHQAGSNRGEYATIGPMLATLGFNALAIDQRSGGNAWGRSNDTIKRLGKSTGYDEALPDLEAALQWAKSSGETGSIILWGSSYSAALVFLLAASHPREVNAILAFSPGEYLRGPSTVRKAAAQVSIPIFVTSAKDPKEIAVAKSIFDASPSVEKIRFVPQIAGVHGSSTLREDQNPDGTEENWVAVKQFLAKFAAPQ